MARKPKKTCCCGDPFTLVTGVPGAVMRVESLPGLGAEVSYNANDEVVSMEFPNGVSKCAE